MQKLHCTPASMSRIALHAAPAAVSAAADRMSVRAMVADLPPALGLTTLAGSEQVKQQLSPPAPQAGRIAHCLQVNLVACSA